MEYVPGHEALQSIVIVSCFPFSASWFPTQLPQVPVLLSPFPACANQEEEFDILCWSKAWLSLFKMLPIFKTLSCRLCPPIIGPKLVFAPISPDGSTLKILESMQSADLTCMVTHLMLSSMQLHTILVLWIYLFIYSSASNLVCTCNLRIEHTRSVVFFRLVKFVLYSRSFFSSWCFSSNNSAILAAFSFLFWSIAWSFSFSSFSSTSSICSSRSFTILQDLQHLQTKNHVVFQPWTSY